MMPSVFCCPVAVGLRITRAGGLHDVDDGLARVGEGRGGQVGDADALRDEPAICEQREAGRRAYGLAPLARDRRRR